MKVVVSGASGMIGSVLVPALHERGHEVVRLGRAGGAPEDAVWDPATWSIEVEKLAGVDAAVNLAGESVGTRWNDAKKRAIMDSRAKGTRLLAETMASLDPKPRVLVSMSGVGYYGAVRADTLSDESSAGDGFLADVCRAWEEGTQPASNAGIRVAILRMGVVLSPKGGALANMLTPFKLGVGGPIAGGKNWLSWISLDDAVGAIMHALTNESLSGAMIACAPNAVTNGEFTKTLGRVLGRPAVLPLPAAALRMMFGEMADEALLASQRCEPGRLIASGYRFQHPELEGALRRALGRESSPVGAGGPET